MNKRFSKVAHIAAAGALVLGLSAFDGLRAGPDAASAREAQAIPGTFKSSIVVANPGATIANVSLNFVNSNGTAALQTPLTFTVAAGSSVTQFVPNVPNLADGRYSVVVDSDQNVVAIANLQSDGPSTATAYNGISQNDVGTTFYVPSVYKNYFGFSSSLVVQNAGNSDATVTITYKKPGQADVPKQVTVKSNASVTIDQAASDSGLNDGFIGSAVISSNQSVAAIFLISKTSGTAAQLSSSRGVKSGSTSVSLPALYHNYYNYRSSVLVQNVDTAAADVQVEYFTGGRSIGTDSGTIGPGATQLFLQFDTDSRNATPRPGFNGSAVVRSTNGKNVIAVANIENVTEGVLEAYNGFNPSSATAKTTCPAIMKNYYGFFTSLTIQNVDTVAGTVSVAHTNPNGQAAGNPISQTVQPGATMFVFSPDDLVGLPNGFNGTAVVTSNGAKIVATVSERSPDAGDLLFTYNCANS